MSDGFDQLDKATQLSSEGSGGDIAKIVVLAGWRVYVPGMSNTESFVPFNPDLEGDSKKKYVEAQKLLPVGSEKKPLVVVRFITLKNSVLTRDVSNWKGDYIEDVIGFTDAYKKVVKPANDALKAAGKSLVLDKPFWVRKSYAPDPSIDKRTGLPRMKENYKKGEEGQPDMVPEMVPFIAEIYASESEARAAAAERSASAGASNTNGNAQQQDLSDDPIAQYEASPDDLKELQTKLMTAAKGVKALPKATFDERVNTAIIAIGTEEIADDEEYLTGNLPKLREWAGLKS